MINRPGSYLNRRNVSAVLPSQRDDLYSSSLLTTPVAFQRTHSVATSSPSSHEQRHSDSLHSQRRSFFDGESSSSYPYAYSEDNRCPDRTRRSSRSALWHVIPCLLVMFLPWIPSHQKQEVISSQRGSIDSLISEQRMNVLSLDATSETIRDMRRQIETLTRENEKSFKDIHRASRINDKSDVPSGLKDLDQNEQYLEVEKIEEGFVARIDGLEKHIQETSRSLVEKTYGATNEPYRVQVNVVDDQSPTGDVSSFVIELALLSEMPHSVHHFLQMVEQKLWDGLALIHVDGFNTVMATPMAMGSHHSWEGQRFENANLTHTAFTEHSTTYPPEGRHKYSVVFSGHPGGPNFYIRLQDETEEEIDTPHHPESTFGMIVEGADVLDRYFGRPPASSSTSNTKKNIAPRVTIEQSGHQRLTMESLRLLPLAKA